MNSTPDEERWEQRFRALGSLPPEIPNPFFYTRLRARLDRQERAGVLDWLRRPAYALGAFGLLVGLNASALLYSPDTPVAGDAATYEGFVTDYQPTHPTDYLDE